MTTPYTIRDRILAIIDPKDGTYKKTRKTPVPQLQPEQLPALSVFVLTGNASPDGDGNAGPIAIINTDTIAISVARGFDDPEVLEGRLDAEVDAFKTKLFTDPDFTALGPNGLWESIAAIRRNWFFPKSGEAYFAELRLEIDFKSREDFEPNVTTPFTGINMTARPMLNPDAPLISKHIDPPQE